MVTALRRNSKPGSSGLFPGFSAICERHLGGMKESGIGREGGVHSLEFYTELKNVCIKL